MRSFVYVFRRMDYLARVVPAVFKIQRVWHTVRERAFVTEMRWLSIRVQSHVRRLLEMEQVENVQPIKHVLFGAIILGAVASTFRRAGLNEEYVNDLEVR